MNVEMIRQNYGVKQITLNAMSGKDFSRLINSLDSARYPERNYAVCFDNATHKEAKHD